MNRFLESPQFVVPLILFALFAVAVGPLPALSIMPFGTVRAPAASQESFWSEPAAPVPLEMDLRVDVPTKEWPELGEEHDQRSASVRTGMKIWNGVRGPGRDAPANSP
jgi:hypothetical protein